MRFLIDECCARIVADRLRMAGHDVRVAQASLAGASDYILAQVAIAEDRVIVTEDYDFGELSVRAKMPIPAVILLSVVTSDPYERAERLVAVLAEQGDSLLDHLTIIQGDRIRRRRLR